MHRLKVVLSELRNYLGRDKDGLERLAKVEREANALRVALAAEKEKSAEAERIRDLALKERQEAVERMSEAEAGKLREDQRFSQAESRAAMLEQLMRRLTGGLDDVLPVISSARLDSQASRDNLTRAVQRCYPRSPVAAHWLDGEVVLHSIAAWPVFRLEDLITGLSLEQLLRLGLFVANLSSMSLPCVVIGNPGDSEMDIAEFSAWYGENLRRQANDDAYRRQFDPRNNPAHAILHFMRPNEFPLP